MFPGTKGASERSKETIVVFLMTTAFWGASRLKLDSSDVVEVSVSTPLHELWKSGPTYPILIFKISHFRD